MIELRYNGKFFTEPFLAATADLAFKGFADELVQRGIVDEDRACKILNSGFRRLLRTADVTKLQFMWDRALAAEENNVRVVFCIFDHAGWRFFGRI